jgi:hypothetical protein
VSGDYLWDGSGEPDPEIRRLEAALRPLRRLPPPPAWSGRARPRFERSLLAVAATVLLATGAALAPSVAVRPAWELVWLGDGGAPGAGRLREGEWLDTGARRARLAVGDIGEVRLEPRTSVALVDAGRDTHRLSLARGRLHATIWAPPGRFLVDTPSARAVDLGCAYTLEVAADGSGLLRVESGWVGFEEGGFLSLVPAGASCRTRVGRGPGTPRFDTASPSFAAALDALDAGAAGAARADALTRALAGARTRDALSLWHLLSRGDDGERGRVYDRLAVLVPPPDGVTRAGVLAGDRGMRERWWDELGLDSSDFWRQWTRPDAASLVRAAP